MERLHLWFSDPHDSPDKPKDRADWLGNAIIELQPDVVGCLGDLSSLDSCSEHELDINIRHELADDAHSAREFQARIWQPTLNYNARQRLTRHKQYLPKTYLIKGNHEDRLDRMRKKDPRRLGSVVDVDDYLGFSSYWDTIVPYREGIIIDDIYFTHVPMNKMGRPMGGVNRGRTILQAADDHVVYGHTHSLDFTTLPCIGPMNRVRCALNLPAYMPQDHHEAYIHDSTAGWCYGIVLIRPRGRNRAFEFEYIDMDTMKRKYG